MADYGSLQDHADAFLELLYAEVNPTVTVYPEETGGSTTVPNAAVPPFVSVHLAVHRPLGYSLSHRSTRMVADAYVHCVGGDDIAARAVSDLVAAALLDKRPAIAGRTVFPIRHINERPPRKDESTGSLLVTLTEMYRLESLPGVDGS